MLQFGCKGEPQQKNETINIEDGPINNVKGGATSTSDMDVGAPIVMRSRDKVEIYNIARDSNFRIERSVTTKNYKNGTAINVFSSGILQFEVPLRMDYPVEDWKYEGVDSVAAISDIEGSYDALLSWLKGNSIIAEDLKWSFGNNHLIFNGDMMDRGDEVFQSLWLIYKLEAEAEMQGGKVHFIFGNHEQLNIQGFFDKANLRYVNRRYFNEADVIGLDYSKWLSNQTELGRWIRSKNTILLINNELFVHGGISPKLIKSGLSIQEINDITRATMDISSKEYDKTQMLLAREDGPLWYRGLADEDLTENQVDEILNYFDCNRIIIGHTMINGDEIQPLYSGKVIPIDLAVKKNFRKGIVKGMLLTSEGLFELDNKNKTQLIEP